MSAAARRGPSFPLANAARQPHDDMELQARSDRSSKSQRSQHPQTMCWFGLVVHASV